VKVDKAQKIIEPIPKINTENVQRKESETGKVNRNIVKKEKIIKPMNYKAV